MVVSREAVGAAAAHLRGVQIRTELSRFTRKTNRLSVKDLSAFGSTSRAKQRSETGRVKTRHACGPVSTLDLLIQELPHRNNSRGVRDCDVLMTRHQDER
jgi:hypothetical protein